MTRIPRVHVLTNDQILATPDFLSRSKKLLQLPIALHLRSRTMAGIRLQALVMELTSVTSAGRVFVNDRVDVAIAAGAHGVHLPERGLPPDRVRAHFGDDLIIGVSAHASDAAARALRLGSDYVFLGPVWPTSSHPERPPIGLEALREVKHGNVIAIGGVTVDRVTHCMDSGAYGVATISAIWRASDPPSAARAVCDIFRGAGRWQGGKGDVGR